MKIRSVVPERAEETVGTDGRCSPYLRRDVLELHFTGTVAWWEIDFTASTFTEAGWWLLETRSSKISLF